MSCKIRNSYSFKCTQTPSTRNSDQLLATENINNICLSKIGAYYSLSCHIEQNAKITIQYYNNICKSPAFLGQFFVLFCFDLSKGMALVIVFAKQAATNNPCPPKHLDSSRQEKGKDEGQRGYAPLGMSYFKKFPKAQQKDFCFYFIDQRMSHPCLQGSWRKDFFFLYLERLNKEQLTCSLSTHSIYEKKQKIKVWVVLTNN